MHTAVMMAAVAVLGFFFRLPGSRGVLVPLGFGLAFGRAGIHVFGFRSLAFLLAFVLGLIRAGGGSVSVRLEASTESASMRMAASLGWGRGPG